MAGDDDWGMITVAAVAMASLLASLITTILLPLPFSRGVLVALMVGNEWPLGSLLDAWTR